MGFGLHLIEGDFIASGPLTLPVTEFLREIFFCQNLNRKQVFSPQELTARHNQLVRIHPKTR